MVSPSLTAECTMAWKAKYVDAFALDNESQLLPKDGRSI
jgi:hypothetical protein